MASWPLEMFIMLGTEWSQGYISAFKWLAKNSLFHFLSTFTMTKNENYELYALILTVTGVFDI